MKMKQAVAAILMLIGFTFSVVCQTKSDPKSEAAVRRTDADFHKAFRLEDAATLESLLTPGFLWTHSTGNIQTKAVILANVRSGKTAYESVETDDLQIDLYTNAAVVNGRSTRRYPGKDIFWIRYTAVYVKEKGIWKAAAFHSSHLPNANTTGR
jgi:ketosteroid isomerase-like protein